MLAAATKLKNAQNVKKYLLKNKLLNTDYKIVKELGFLYFPILKSAKVPGAKVVDTKFIFEKRDKPLTIEDILKDKLTKKELKLIPKTQEIVGDILILEVPEILEKKEKVIAQAYLKVNKQIKTVVKKEKHHSGVYRTRKVRILAGIKKKDTIHIESGVKIYLHLEKSYFSARLGNERLRIAKQIKPDENVLVMFSGSAPYPLVLARHSKANMIYGIEINPMAHQFALKNIELNNFEEKIKVYEGDVRKIMPKIKKKFDRILMPLPKTSEEFLDIALKKSFPGTIIHLYAFLSKDELTAETKKIKQICQNNKIKTRILRKVTCGQFSPRTFRFCFDIKVL